MFILAGDDLIPLNKIDKITIDDIEKEIVKIHVGSDIYVAKGFDAIEAVMLIKPSAMEGRRLKWRRGAWAFHNMIGHPLMQLLSWLGFNKLAIKVHDRTTPRPR